MFKVNNKDTKTTPMASFWCLYCKLLTYFIPCSNVSIARFEQVNADWGICPTYLIPIFPLKKSSKFHLNFITGKFSKLWKSSQVLFCHCYSNDDPKNCNTIYYIKWYKTLAPLLFWKLNKKLNFKHNSIFDKKICFS